jgi:hypothetical protein
MEKPDNRQPTASIAKGRAAGLLAGGGNTWDRFHVAYNGELMSIDH